jgi:tRNA A-37 threonylcarbamoyl transferase component Bud32
MGRSKQRANARTLTLGEFFKETQVNRTSGLLGARLARRRAESDSDDADDGETTDALECAIGNAARASGEGTYDVTCFARGGRGTMKSALFVFGGGHGERRVDEAPFECELRGVKTSCDVEVTVTFDRVLGVRPVRELHAVELSNERAEFSRTFTVEVKTKALARALGKVGTRDGGNSATPKSPSRNASRSSLLEESQSRGVDAWSIGDVSEWLKSSELEELVDAFASAKVNGYELLRLTEADLKQSLHLERNLERVRVIRAINILRASAGAADAEKGNADEKTGVTPPLSKPLGAPRGGLSPLELELDVSWIEFISEKARASVLIGWFMHVLDEVKAAEYDEPGPQLSVYCEATLQASRSCEDALEERVLDILESTPGWDPRRKLFPSTCDLTKLGEQLMQLYLEVKAFEEFAALNMDDEHTEYERPRSTPAKMPGENSPAGRSSRTQSVSPYRTPPSDPGLSTPSPSRLNVSARSFSPTPLSDLSRSILPEDEPVEGDRVMELNTEWEIDYKDIEFEGGVPSSQNRIGHGGFGEVFLGRYHGSLVAVKKLFNQDMMGKGLSDFRREVQILSRLRHPSIVLWLGACTQAPNLTIVLEYMDKGSLHQFLHRTTTPYTTLTLTRWAMTIAQGMVYLHSAKPFPIVHCDLNTNNVLVNRDGMVKITDFGLSKVKHSSRLSRQTGMTGTVNYASPEVIRGGKFSEASDVFAYGVILWELLTRRIPWEDLNEYQIVFQMTSDLDASLAATAKNLELPASAPEGYRKIIHGAWATQPERRSAFKDVLGDLREVYREQVDIEKALRAARKGSTSSLSAASAPDK